MIQHARKRLLIAALTFVMSGAFAVPAQAGIVPWMWDTVFGPVGSIRARRMCSVGYGMRNQCGYGPSICNPCGGGCNSCGGGYGPISYAGGCASGNCGSGGCASGSCGVYFTPDATQGNLTPTRDNPPPSPSSAPPTFREQNSNTPRTNVSPGYVPPAAPGEFVAPPANNSPANNAPSNIDSAIPPEKRGPMKRPVIGGDDESQFHPAPLNRAGSQVTWSSRNEVERQAGRTLGTRSVQVVRQASFPNSKWEVAGEHREVAKK